jgi:flagellar protein FliO/FliZ
MAPPPKPRVPAALVAAGVLVVAVGFGLPRLVAPPPAAATAAPSPAADDPGLRRGLVKLAGCFALVCGGCVLVVQLAAARTPPKPGATRVLAALPLDGRCVVQLVKAGDRRLLVGLDPGGVKALLELPGPPPGPIAPPPPAAAPAAVVGPVKVAAPDDPELMDRITAVIARLTAKPPA